MRRGGSDEMAIIECLAGFAAVGAVSILIVVAEAGRITISEAWSSNVDAVENFVLIVLLGTIIVGFARIMCAFFEDQC